jgi:hypothetical protein
LECLPVDILPYTPFDEPPWQPEKALLAVKIWLCTWLKVAPAPPPSTTIVRVSGLGQRGSRVGDGEGDGVGPDAVWEWGPGDSSVS